MAIVQPYEMDFTEKNFSMIISGPPGVGKTTLALSAPEPILIDFDKGISRVKAEHRKTTIISNTYEEILQDMQSPEVAQAKTVIIDTGGSFITYLQEYVMRKNPTQNRNKDGSISLKGFGATKGEFTSFTNRLQYTLNKNIIYIFHTVEEKTREGNTVQRLLCEGAARNVVWQPCDLGCYMQVVGKNRVLGFSPTEEYFAKGCYGIYGEITVPDLSAGKPNTFLTDLFNSARAQISAETEQFEKQREEYQAAIDEGQKIISEITDIDTLNASVEKMRNIQHSLTSEREVKAMFTAKVHELDATYDKEEGCYVAKVSDDSDAS